MVVSKYVSFLVLDLGEVIEFHQWFFQVGVRHQVWFCRLSECDLRWWLCEHTEGDLEVPGEQGVTRLGKVFCIAAMLDSSP